MKRLWQRFLEWWHEDDDEWLDYIDYPYQPDDIGDGWAGRQRRWWLHGEGDDQQ